MSFTGLPISTIAWAAAFAAVAITVLYLLRLRRRRVEVPFSPLWAQVASRRMQSDRRRLLRRILSWLLHLTIAALLLFAALGPHFDEEIVDERHVLILVDNSASMAATDVSGAHDRFELARDEAIELLGTIGGDDRVMVATFNDEVQPLGTFVDDPSLLKPALADQRWTANPADLNQALRFAADSLRDRQPAELVVISDGAGVDDTASLDVDFGDETTVRHRKVGESSENVAITAFEARRYPANRLDHQVFLQLHSYFDRPVDVTLQILADDTPVENESLRLEPGEPHRQFYPELAAAGERLEARLRLDTDDARDVFPLDDRAFATIPPPQRLDVQLVSSGNLYLEGPLLIGTHIELETVHPDDYDPGAEFDVTIFDGVDAEPPDTGDVLYFAPHRDSSPFDIAGEDNEPIVTDVLEDHPLVRWVQLDDLNIARTTTFDAAVGDTAVVESFGQPIIIARETDDRRKAAVGFDVRDSDFPLRVGFPVFLLNAMDWFADDDDELQPGYPTGTTWSIPVDDGADSATITDPDDRRHTAAVHDGQALFYGELPGFHTVETDRESITVAANLADPAESDITPQQLEFDDVDVEQDTDELIFDRRQVWMGLLFAALALLMIEWITFNRRWTV